MLEGIYQGYKRLDDGHERGWWYLGGVGMTGISVVGRARMKPGFNIFYGVLRERNTHQGRNIGWTR